MIWTYGEFVSAPKWQDMTNRQNLTNSVYANWESTAIESDLVPVDGTATETLVPLWQLPNGSLTDIAIQGQSSVALALKVSGEVV